MFDFEYWLEGIVGTCELIASKDVFERAWILGDKTLTSIHYPDELLEQLLGDLHLEECVERFASNLREIGAFEVVAAFANALIELEGHVKSNAGLQDPKALLASQEWARLQLAAERVVELPFAQKYRSDRAGRTP